MLLDSLDKLGGVICFADGGGGYRKDILGLMGFGNRFEALDTTNSTLDRVARELPFRV